MAEYYSEQEARRLVIEAGHRLAESGLIARTWGNISARISKEECIITPSGLAYENLKPEDLPKLKLTDLSYEGGHKPSSEKGIHAICYTLRPEVTFIIHTHQFYASVLGIDGQDHAGAANAAYGLPGTEKLRTAVMQAVSKNAKADCFLMQKHGALCLGKDFEDAFALAEALEENCKSIYCDAVFQNRIPPEIAGETGFYDVFRDSVRNEWIPAYIDDFAQMFGSAIRADKPFAEIVNPSNRINPDDVRARELLLEKNAAAALYANAVNRGPGTKARPLSAVDAALQRFVYLKKYSRLKNK